jgi:hypothetical protein
MPVHARQAPPRLDTCLAPGAHVRRPPVRPGPQPHAHPPGSCGGGTTWNGTPAPGTPRSRAPRRPVRVRRQGWRAVAALPRHEHPPGCPLMPVLALFRVVPPGRPSHSHDAIRTCRRIPVRNHPARCLPGTGRFCPPARRLVTNPGTAGERSGVRARLAADGHPRCSAFLPAARLAGRPGRQLRARRRSAFRHDQVPLQVVWYWQAVAVVRSLPVRL